MIPSIRFCGAAGTVTGSCYWLRTEHGEILIDCGMFQGSKTLKELNYGAFPFDPAKLDAVLLTHAHIDHAGLLPKLINAGFRRKVFMTAATADLLSYMLPDSGYIQEAEVEELNRRNAQRGRPSVKPIFTRQDAIDAQKQFALVDYEQWQNIRPGLRARYWNAGHILGAASIELEIAATDSDAPPMRLLFSGDIGPEHKLFHPDPDGPVGLDYLVCESTYGGRRRERMTLEQRRRHLAQEVETALHGGGVLLIPAFAVERTQELLADLAALMNSSAVRRVPVFLDSPLAIRATSVFAEHAHDLEDIDGGGAAFQHPNFHFTESVEQSKAISRYNGGIIVLAGSGMCDAGRIRHHLKNYLWRDNATVLLVGYQAPGTLGSLLATGKSAVKIWGQDVQVRARIRQTEAYSGHADGAELVEWIKDRGQVRGGVFLTHGEEESLTALKRDLIDGGIANDKIFIPELDQEFYLRHDTPTSEEDAIPRRLLPELVGKTDWHNDLAAFTLDLREKLENTADAKAKKALLRRLQRALDSDQ